MVQKTKKQKNNTMKHLKTFNEMIGSGDYASFHNKNNEPFWGNTGAGCIIISLSSGRILLPYRSKFVNEPNCFGVIGGKIDEEEGQSESDIEDVVKREFEEETGFRGDIQLIPAYVFQTSNKSFTYYNFIGLTDKEFTPVLNWETESFKWVTFDEMMKIEPKHFGLKGLLNDPSSMSIIRKYAR